LLLAFQLVAASSAQAAPGDLDTSFGTGGKVTTDFGNGDVAHAVVLQPDGKIVAAGRSVRDFALARYQPDGTLDTTFSTDGKVTTDIAGGDDVALAVALQPDGKIVAAGSASTGATEDFALARYNPDGTLDTTFSTDGKVTTDFAGGNDVARDVALQPDGKIVAAGASGSDFALARYNPDGTLDTTFSTDGKVTTDFAGGHDEANAMALQPNGKIVAAGFADTRETFDFALARYKRRGTLDPSFSKDGKVTTDIAGSDDFASGVAFAPDGKIVAAGNTIAATLDFAVARYKRHGTLDPSFSTDGKVTTDFASGNDFNFAVVVQPDGKIVAAGIATTPGDDFGLVRYNPDGTLDLTFGGDGKVTTDIAGDDQASDLALQPDGKIVVAGIAFGFTEDFALARYLVE